LYCFARLHSLALRSAQKQLALVPVPPSPKS
jgi:hypothetical protein